MTTAVFTSCTYAYWPQARVLGRSLAKHMPDWERIAVVTDRLPPDVAFDVADEPFDRIILAEDLPIDDFPRWLFGHQIVEACTAVKGPAMVHLLEAGYDRVFYLDPDIAVFNSLEPLERILDDADVVLTPHIVSPSHRPRAIVDCEINALKYGTFNLGFIGARASTNGQAAMRWWRDRLLTHCVDDLCNGLFTDQRWCDLLPTLFPGVAICRDPGYNVASWNLDQRHVAFDQDGQIRCNDVPLRFYHFTKFWGIGELMTSIYAGDALAVFELWEWYRRDITASLFDDLPERYWFWGRYDDGTPIADEHRRLYRERPDLREAFPNPYATDEPANFLAWLTKQHQTATASGAD